MGYTKNNNKIHSCRFIEQKKNMSLSFQPSMPQSIQITNPWIITADSEALESKWQPCFSRADILVRSYKRELYLLWRLNIVLRTWRVVNTYLIIIFNITLAFYNNSILLSWWKGEGFFISTMIFFSNSFKILNRNNNINKNNLYIYNFF